MKLEAVGLDDHRLRAPEEVHLVGPHPDVDLGRRQAPPTAKRQEEALELAAGELGAAVEVCLGDQPQIDGLSRGAPNCGWGRGAWEVRRVLAGRVNEMQWWLVTAPASSCERWIVMPSRRARPASVETVT